MDYTKEYPELALKYNTQIVFHQTNQDKKDPKISKRHLIIPPVWEHPKKTEYTIKTLVASITNILTVLTDEQKAKEIMIKLKEQVNDSLNSISIFRNIHENDREFVHCHCLVIAFYLDHFEGESGKKNNLNFFEQEI